jgi:hypothetical protein
VIVVAPVFCKDIRPPNSVLSDTLHRWYIPGISFIASTNSTSLSLAVSFDTINFECITERWSLFLNSINDNKELKGSFFIE